MLETQMRGVLVRMSMHQTSSCPDLDFINTVTNFSYPSQQPLYSEYGVKHRSLGCKGTVL